MHSIARGHVPGVPSHVFEGRSPVRAFTFHGSKMGYNKKMSGTMMIPLKTAECFLAGLRHSS